MHSVYFSIPNPSPASGPSYDDLGLNANGRLMSFEIGHNLAKRIERDGCLSVSISGRIVDLTAKDEKTGPIFSKILQAIAEEENISNFFIQNESRKCEIVLDYFPGYACYILGFNVYNENGECNSSMSPGVSFAPSEIE